MMIYCITLNRLSIGNKIGSNWMKVVWLGKEESRIPRINISEKLSNKKRSKITKTI